MSDSPGEKPSTRELIVDCAYHLFISNGYHGTSMRQIAQEAGIAVSGIYNHFPSKEDIFVAVLEAYHPFRKILPVVESIKSSNLDTYFHALGDQSISVLKARPEFLNLLLIEIVEFNSAHVSILFELYYPEILKFVEQLSALRAQMRDIPPPMIVRSFIGMIYAYYLTDSLVGAYFPPEMVVDAFDCNIDIFLHGIMPPPDGGA
jgi:AcrR family transcriptional regulator